MHTPLLSAALQNQADNGLVQLQIHLKRFVLHTGVQ